tara:strand:+ start:40080 stop:40427 length:348 start_codon:yes stop_codon:yes gene_type:complete
MSDKLNIPKNPNFTSRGRDNPKKKIEEAFDAYKGLLADKTHPDNQTAAYNKNVISILNRLLVAADDLDETNPGEGIFGLIVLSLRTNLKLKDELVKQEVKLRETSRELEKLKKRK